MTNQTDMTNTKRHGGYRNLKSYQTATFIYDLTVKFVEAYIDRFSRTRDQMVQAARSGRQNIAEGSQASATSKKTEIKLIGVARASLEELLIDYDDFLRQRGLKLWEKDSAEAKTIRGKAANCLICLIHQANFLLDRQLQALEAAFLKDGGYTENLFKRRIESRR